MPDCVEEGVVGGVDVGEAEDGDGLFGGCCGL